MSEIKQIPTEEQDKAMREIAVFVHETIMDGKRRATASESMLPLMQKHAHLFADRLASAPSASLIDQWRPVVMAALAYEKRSDDAASNALINAVVAMKWRPA